ncbi:MAG: hypothetical protein IKP22_12995 [Clostridia bacterium]|nr:hypothetical protein [Clostridia bacterium]
MNKILFSADPEISYIFHMLSVSKCGYDNAYGEKYRGRYDPADLKCLKDQELHLTVRGGEHCGDWYGPMVCEPVRTGMAAKDYYTETIAWIRSGSLDLPGDTLDSIIRVCRVMIRHYDDYMENIWPAERDAITEHIDKVRTFFEGSTFTEKAEAAVGVSLPPPWFTAVLVSSIEGGAQAIDITASQDVFGTDLSPETAKALISHEFIIYLLKIALKDENAFQSPKNWTLTEGLAEYYLQKIDGGVISFRACQEQADAYRQLEKTCGTNAAALYRAASKR